MAISTYANLQTSIATWLERADLGAIIPDFIVLFEAYVNRTLRTRWQEDSTSLATVDGVAALPTDFLNWRSLTWEGDPSLELEYVSPQYLRSTFGSTDQGTPRFFTIEGSNITIRPTSDDDSFTLRYFKRFSSLSDSNTTNWLLTGHPDAYLFGSLVEAQAYIPDFEKAGMWKRRRDEICDEIQRLSNAMRGGGAIRPFGPTP